MLISPRLPDQAIAQTAPKTVGPGLGVRPKLDGAERDRLRRRQLSHDMHHELGTITMLASLLTTAPDVGEESRKRARQILGEARWLEQLQRAYGESAPERARPLRLDLVAAEVVEAMRLCSTADIRLTTGEAWAYVDRLALWRALRNVLGNALRATGASGRVDIRVFAADGWSVTEIEDNGPGFGAIEPGLASLGLGIVQEVATAWAGHLECRRGRLGGCCIRLRLPTAPGDGRRTCGC
ncbi:sensor histidine kinase [Dactylosporangium sp. NPDC051484]|uniref:sensor histidine kinase n=1 Tax=Dactylosporangium sp. NPDC051484 TaxID=3154942 RepID=UPI003450EA05